MLLIQELHFESHRSERQSYRIHPDTWEEGRVFLKTGKARASAFGAGENTDKNKPKGKWACAWQKVLQEHREEQRWLKGLCSHPSISAGS